MVSNANTCNEKKYSRQISPSLAGSSLRRHLAWTELYASEHVGRNDRIVAYETDERKPPGLY